MGRAILSSLAISFVAVAGWAQTDNRIVLGKVNEYLAAGSLAISAGRYDEGIRLTSLGLEMDDATPRQRATALANVCAAHAAMGEPDPAIERCTESLTYSPTNWRAFSNRAYAYYLKELYTEALRDVEAAAAIAPGARQVQQIREMINERTLRPRVTMEDRR
jgi:tetratricopeptide (TPR) repeat protein